MKKLREDRRGNALVFAVLFMFSAIVVYFIVAYIVAPPLLESIIDVTQTYVDTEGGHSTGWMNTMMGNLRFWGVAVGFILLAVVIYPILIAIRRRWETQYYR